MDITNFVTLPTEIIFDILLRLHYKDIINVCQVSSQLRPFCNDNNLWIVKAKRDLGIDLYKYVSDPRSNARKKYMLLLNEALNTAVSVGNIREVKYLLSIGPTDLNKALLNAAFNGRLDIVKLLLQHGADDLNGALIEASKGRDLNTVRYLVNAGATSINDALTAASYTAPEEIVDYLESVSMGELGLE